jgi:hypothetical protein
VFILADFLKKKQRLSLITQFLPKEFEECIVVDYMFGFNHSQIKVGFLI